MPEDQKESDSSALFGVSRATLERAMSALEYQIGRVGNDPQLQSNCGIGRLMRSSLVAVEKSRDEVRRVLFQSGRVRDICVCHLPYQSAPFVVGVVDNADSETGASNVWLRRDGTWSAVDGDPECSLAMGGWNPPNAEVSSAS